MASTRSEFRALPLPLQLLIFSQFVFNVGFYLVVPFLANYFEQDLQLAGGVIGLILGLRTFSQQGMFFLGGALTDLAGVKPMVLIGITVRVAAFLVLATMTSLPAVICGVVLIGLAAAMFSPAAESAIVALGGRVELDGGPRRTTTLALENVASRAGSAVGPALGGILIFLPFRWTCAIAAGIFAAMGLIHARFLPHGLRVSERASLRASLSIVAKNKTFMMFALINCVMLVAYNQMYLALPVELTRAGIDGVYITWFFLIASVMVVLGQSVVTRWTDRMDAVTVLRKGYLWTAMSFLVMAPVVCFRPPSRAVAVIPPLVFVILLHMGSMIAGPRSRDTVARLAHEQNLGSYMGVLASLGGLAVLLVSGPVGVLLEKARVPGMVATVPWLLLAVLPLVAASLIGPILRSIPETTVVHLAAVR